MENHSVVSSEFGRKGPMSLARRGRAVVSLSKNSNPYV